MSSKEEGRFVFLFIIDEIFDHRNAFFKKLLSFLWLPIQEIPPPLHFIMRIYMNNLIRTITTDTFRILDSIRSLFKMVELPMDNTSLNPIKAQVSACIFHTMIDPQNIF